MDARVHKSSICRNWKEVYKAALFEDDSSKFHSALLMPKGRWRHGHSNCTVPATIRFASNKPWKMPGISCEC